jgi:hypothetical protein
MPLEHARLRAIEAFRTLRIAQGTASPSSIKVELLCNALQCMRDLLMIHGDVMEPAPVDKKHQEALEFLAHDMPTLILALEVTAVRAEALLKGTAEMASHWATAEAVSA